MGIKVLKKIRRNLRCGKRLIGGNNAASGGQSNLRPILFHSIHSENIRLSRDGAVSRRVESFCKGISFSNRPIKINEKVYLKVAETSTSWSGVLRFGFTSNDPSSIRPSSLPKYTCPDLTNKPGNWGKALTERYARRDNIIYFYVTQNGEVHYGVNGEDKGVFFSGVDVSGNLWALIDVYGNTIAIEIVDPNQHLNNKRRPQSQPQQVNNQPANADISSSISALSINNNNSQAILYHQDAAFETLPFHAQTKGLNITLSNQREVATRQSSEYSQGYVFTSRPLRVNENYVIKISSTDSNYVGSMAFGLTSCNPASVSPRELPSDADHLLDRPEYWVVSKDVATMPERGDELLFRITPNGEVKFQRNAMAPVTIMHVDHTLQLWAFINVYGHTVKIRSLGSFMEQSSRQSSPISFQLQSSTELSQTPVSYDLVQTLDGPVNPTNECVVCYERLIDSVLYTCGHMCMCYDCAVKQWRGQGQGQCPICRAIIRDVIRTYKS